jgi:ubiquitin C-terminal hydrolase
MYYGIDPGELGLAKVSASVSSAGLPNPGVNACFINAALQCFLRLEPVATLLQRHRHAHSERLRWNPDFCAACVMAELAEEMRSGQLSSCRRLSGIVRGGDFGDDFKSPSPEGHVNPQCDASELFLGNSTLGDVRPEYNGFLGILDRWESTGFFAGEQILGAHVINEVRQHRHVLGHGLFGIILRTRIHCTRCNFCSDALEECSFLPVDFPARGAHDRASFQLQDLIASEMTPAAATDLMCGRNDVAMCSAAGKSIRKHRFIEREPAVLVIRLSRQQYDEHGVPRKVLARCVFPEILSFLRTGEYHFASVLLHAGAGPGSGHYRAITWHQGDQYWLFDDDQYVRRITWRETQTAQMQKECYMLIYVRTRFWNDTPSDGIEQTPYARDEASLQRVQRNPEVSAAAQHSCGPGSSGSSGGQSGAPRCDGHDAQPVDRSAFARDAGIAQETSLEPVQQNASTEKVTKGDGVCASQASRPFGNVVDGVTKIPEGGVLPVTPTAKKRAAPPARDLRRTLSLLCEDPVHLSTRSRRMRAPARTLQGASSSSQAAGTEASSQAKRPAPRNLD